MRLNEVIFRNCRFFVILILCISLNSTINAQKKPTQKATNISVSIKVVDDNGTPIPNARVVLGNGTINAETDENGTYSLMAYLDDFITVSASGYEKNVSLVGDIVKNNNIKLKKSKLYLTSDDNVQLPYVMLKKRNLTGSPATITMDQLEKYPTTDIRNSFAGLVPGLQVIERNGSPGFVAEENNDIYGITEKIGVSARGFSLMYIIDGIPMDVTQMPLDPQEIESVTIIKDIVGKTMYGPAAAGGIILIKTKRGRPDQSVFDINVEDGISVIDRFPGWVKGSDYARLNNQARINDNLSPNYSDSDISAYTKNDPYDMYHPSVDWRDMILKNTRSFRKANIAVSGGDSVYQYSSYLGYSGEGDIYKIGSTSDYNRLNARTNLDIRINKYIKISFDIYGNLTFRRSPNYGYNATTGESGSEMDLLELNSVLPDIINTPPIAFPVYANNDPSLKKPWFAVSSNYPINPVGGILNNGYYTESGRSGNVSSTIDFNLSHLVKGLRSQTYFSYYGLRVLRTGKAEDYIAYIITPSTPQPMLTKVHDGVVSPDLTNLHEYYSARYGFYENLSYQHDFGIHDIHLSLTYFLNEFKQDGYIHPQRQQNGVLTGIYTINDKYSIQGVLNYAGTYSLSKYNLFPSIGVSWLISDESFMSDIKFINYLKLRAEAGILGIESFRSPYYNISSWSSGTGSVFGPYSANTWFGNTTETSVYRTYPSRISNPDLTWEKTKEFSVGLDALLFNSKLSLEMSYFNNIHDGEITTLSNTIPNLVGVSSALPYFNYNQTRYSGLETGIQYSEYVGDFKYSFGANATVMNSERLKYDDPDYRFEYQTNVGKAVDTYWGLNCLGKFLSDDEAMQVVQNYDAVLKAGDLKYQDVNEDGVIDDNDRISIGHTTPRLYYSLNANFNYKNFEITIVGTGSAFYDIPLTNLYYMNGWGDNNYSNFVKDNIGGAYPRLTYYRVNNNFLASNFWLTNGDYFKIQNVELAFIIPGQKLQVIRSRGARLFVRGANLLTISKLKDADPESLNSGVTVYPLYKTFTGGIKLTF